MNIKEQFKKAFKWNEGENFVGFSAIFKAKSGVYSMNHQENFTVWKDGRDLEIAIQDKLENLNKSNKSFSFEFGYIV